MEKWADYLISSVKKITGDNNQRYISHVFIHEDGENSFKRGSLMTKDDVISLLKADKRIRTIRWDYELQEWKVGSFVTFHDVEGNEYLKSEPGFDKKDDIENIAPYTA